MPGTQPIIALRRTIPPTLIALIPKMRFFVEPEISCSRFFGEACFTEESIAAYRKASDTNVLRRTEMGDFIAEHMRGGIFIDLPCGLHAARDQGKDFAMVPLAAALGVSAYWEIDFTADVVRDRLPVTIDVVKDDTYQLSERMSESRTREECDIPVTTMQDDLLGFVAKISPEDITLPKAFYLSGMQPDADLCNDTTAQRTIIVPYLEALYDELARVCRTGDLVILNSSDMLVQGIDETQFPDSHPAVALFRRGFSLMRRCKYDKVHVFIRD